MGTSVHFVGKAAVKKAFGKYDTHKWSLWCGKSMMIAYDGGDETESESEFDDWIEMIRGNTTAVYTCKFYEKSVKAIRIDTKEIGSFNFRIATEEMQTQSFAAGNNAIVERLMEKFGDRLDKMDQKIGAIAKPDEERTEAWERALDHPIVMGAIAKAFNIDVVSMLNAANAAPGGAAMAGVPPEVEETIDELRKHDPHIDAHLDKLLRIAQKKPANFKTLIGLLDTMTI